MRLFFLLLFVFPLAAAENPIVTTKRIHIPGYPQAFNPSLIRHGKKLLLTFRICPDQKQYWISYIGTVFLDNYLEIASLPQLLNTRIGASKTPSQSEDARIFSIGGELHLLYNDNMDLINPTGEQRRDIHLAKLKIAQDHLSVQNVLKLGPAPKNSSRIWEKNWVPFEYEGKLLLAYTLVPHEIYAPDLATGKCASIHKSSSTHPWKWGTLRGGTPATVVDGEYLAFFHSSMYQGTVPQLKLQYFIGAYTYSAKPPFEITQMSASPLQCEAFYHPSNYYRKVVYPGGFVEMGNQILLAYGRDDGEVWIATIDKERLKKTLAPIQSHR